MSKNIKTNKEASEVKDANQEYLEEQIVLTTDNELPSLKEPQKADQELPAPTNNELPPTDVQEVQVKGEDSESIIVAPENKKKGFSKALIGTTLISSLLLIGAGAYVLLGENGDTKPQEQKTVEAPVAVKENIIYKSILDSKNLSEEDLFNATYPFSKAAIENTKQYSRSLFEKVDSIIVDPAGENFPSNSGLLPSFPSITYGFAAINVDMNALPKQPLFIRLVTEKDHLPFAVRHFYMSSDMENRVASFEGLSGGKYYFQILNLITQTAYVSNTFNLTSNGIITDSTTLSFLKINEIDHIFRLPLEDENSALLVEDLPIVLNADINREVLDFSKGRAIKEASEEIDSSR